MTQFKGYRNPSTKGLAKGYRNPDLNNSNATSTSNATSKHLNTTQLHHQLKPRRGLEESKAKSVNSRNRNGIQKMAMAMCETATASRRRVTR